MMNDATSLENEADESCSKTSSCIRAFVALVEILVIIIALLAPTPVVTAGSAVFYEGLSAILGPLMRWGTMIFAAMFALVAFFHAGPCGGHLP